MPPSHGKMYAIKNHAIASLGEFVGTFLFLFFAFGAAQTANQPSSGNATTGPNTSQLLYISLAFGFSLAICVWIFFRVSGGLFNPAVTLALCVCGVVPVLRSVFIIISQLIAGICAAAVIRGLTPGNNVLFGVQLREGVSVAQGLFIEMFLTSLLVFTILMLAAEKTKSTFVAPVGIGLALFVAELYGVYWTGGALNPTRAFGPDVVSGSFPGYHWLYWLGPVFGALLASGFYALLKFFNYEEVNGDQDKSEEDEKLEGALEDEHKKNGKKPNDKQKGDDVGNSRFDFFNQKSGGNGMKRNRDEEDQHHSQENHRESRPQNDNRRYSRPQSQRYGEQRYERQQQQQQQQQQHRPSYEQHSQSYDQPQQTQARTNSSRAHEIPIAVPYIPTSSSGNRQQEYTLTEYNQREARSKAFAPVPDPLHYDEEHEFDDLRHSTSQRSGNRRTSLTRRDRELGYRTDNVEEVGGPAHTDMRREGSGRRDRRY